MDLLEWVAVSPEVDFARMKVLLTSYSSARKTVSLDSRHVVSLIESHEKDAVVQRSIAMPSEPHCFNM